MRFYTENKKKINIVLIVIAIIAIFLTVGNRFFPKYLYNAVSFVTTPFQKGTVGVSDRLGSFKEKNKVLSENKKLKEENEELMLKLNTLENVKADNKELNSLLETKAKYPEYPTVTARIIGKDSNNWFNSFSINKGYDDGIEQDMIVVANGSLVGKVSECTKNSSKVITILDNSSSVSSVNSRTGDLGLLKGDIKLINDNLTLLEYYDQDAEIIEGDEIVTSSVSSVYPPNLSIGKVKSLYDSRGSLTKNAIVTPDVDFKHLSTVLVITQKFTKTKDTSDSEVFDIEPVIADEKAKKKAEEAAKAEEEANAEEDN